MLTIYTKPGVYLAGTSSLRSIGLERFYEAENVSPEKQLGTVFTENDQALAQKSLDLIPEIAGRLCYMSYDNPRPGGNAKYLEHILDVDHGSVLEHSNVSFIITGVSRSLTHELVRHRAGMAYSQLSQRYVDESDVSIVIPPDRLPTAWPFITRMINHYGKTEGRKAVHLDNCILMESESCLRDLVAYGNKEFLMEKLPDEIKAEESWFQAIFRAFLTYSRDVEIYTKAWQGTKKDLSSGNKTELRKAVRQMARSILPNCTETKIFVTGNIRAWRHIMKMRGSLAADVEIRRLAIAIFAVLKDLAPNSFQDMEVAEISDTKFIRRIN